MRTVSETDAKRRFAALLDEAQREPVVIRRRDRDIAVLMSPREYERLCATGPSPAQPAAAGGLTDTDLGDIVADDDGG